MQKPHGRSHLKLLPTLGIMVAAMLCCAFLGEVVAAKTGWREWRVRGAFIGGGTVFTLAMLNWLIRSGRGNWLIDKEEDDDRAVGS